MTEIEKEVTREKTETKTVLTCDFCGIPEIDLRDGESIVRFRDGVTFEVTYVLIRPDESEKKFDDIHSAKMHMQTLDSSYRSNCETKTRLSASCDLNVEVCEHCIDTLFSAADEADPLGNSPAIQHI